MGALWVVATGLGAQARFMSPTPALDETALDDLEVGSVTVAAVTEVVDVLVAGLSDSPLAAAVYGGRPDRLGRVLVGIVRESDGGLLAARFGRRAVGAAVMTATPDGWRLGPTAVLPGLRGRGVGTRLLGVCLARVDATGEAAVALVDTARAAALLGRLGFEGCDHELRAGVPTWSMRRPGRHDVNR